MSKIRERRECCTAVTSDMKETDAAAENRAVDESNEVAR